MLRHLRIAAMLSAALSLVGGVCLAEINVKLTPDQSDGVYAAGETATWAITADDDGKPCTGTFTYRLLLGGHKVSGKGAGEFADGKASLSASRADAGTILAEVMYAPEGVKKKTRALGGAVFSPYKITPSAEEPEDFDAFWTAKKAKLVAIPMNVQLTPGDSGDENVEYAKITMDNIRGTHVYGQIAKPKDGTKLPAMLQVQYAGVYGLKKGWVTGRAKQGWLSMNIIAHDIPIDLPAERYKELSKGELAGYPKIGNLDRETSYFLRMYLSCYRAVDYLTKRPDWNGKVLFVQGGSQGGLQTIMTAGFHPAVTGIAASVPAGCDHTGLLVDRSPGWPKWVYGVKEEDKEKANEASKYYDVVNFARRVKCPAVVGVGLIDTTCPPEGVCAMFNQLKGDKRLVTLPTTGHGGKGGNFRPYYNASGAWIEAAKTGKPFPQK